MKDTSPLSDKVYAFLVDYIDKHVFSPSTREIADKFHTSTSAVSHALGILEGRELIRRKARTARSITLVLCQNCGQPPSNHPNIMCDAFERQGNGVIALLRKDDK